MGNTTSFNNVTQIVGTGGGLLLDASAFANMSSNHGPVSLTFDTVWVVDAGDAPLGPYEAATPSGCRLRVIVGRAGPEREQLGSEDDETWWVTWSPEKGEDVKYTHVRWSEMSYGELDVFQHGFSASLKQRLDSPGAIPLTEDPILGEALDGIEVALGI